MNNYTLHRPSETDYILKFSTLNNMNLYTASVDASTDPYNVFVNGFSIGDSSNLNNTSTKDGLYFIHFNSVHNGTKFSIINSSDSTDRIDFTVDGVDVKNADQKRLTKMIDDDTSYQLLRVNPKLTGNIKVVVDSSNNIYLDTFKVSDGLSQKKFRKVAVSKNDYYGRNIMSIFKELSSTDLYRIEDSCYELISPATTLEDQYYDKYNCGVRTNNDNLYKENYSILAPLCIKKNIPDFFLIFKVKDYENLETNKDKINHFIQNGELIKSFDLRSGSAIGDYIKNIYNHSKTFIGDIYTSYDYNSNNIINGISIDKGVVANVYEATEEERGLKNQVAMNDWYTLSFERNRIVSKNIINLEFMFDDDSAEMFSLNTYFGLYVKLYGEDENFCCNGVVNGTYVFDTNVVGSMINKLDSSVITGIGLGNNQFISDKSSYVSYCSVNKGKTYVSNSSYIEFSTSNPSVGGSLTDINLHNYGYKYTPTKDGYISIINNTTPVYESSEGFNPSEYKDVIYGLSDSSSFTRTFNNISKEGEKYYNKVQTAIDSTFIKNVQNESKQSYVSITFDDVLNTGEHFRLIDKTTNITRIFDVIISGYNDEHYKYSQIDSSILVNKETYTISLYNIGYRKNQSSETKEYEIKRQIKLLSEAFEQFNDVYINDKKDNFKVRYTDSKMSIVYNISCSYSSSFDTGIIFEKILSDCGYNDALKSLLESGKIIDKSIKFFGVDYYDNICINSTDGALYPTGFEHLGERLMQAVKMIPLNISYECTHNLNDTLNNYRTIIYKKSDNKTYETLEKTIIYFYNKNAEQYFVDGFSKNCYVITFNDSKKQPSTLNDKIIFYQPMQINAGICSIYPIKDFNFDVIDNQSQMYIETEKEFTISDTAGEYQNNNNIYGTILSDGCEESICDYIDKRCNYNDWAESSDKIFNGFLSSDSESASYIGQFINYQYTNNHKKMSIPLIAPYCCKWKTVGTDARGESLRLMYPFKDSSSSSKLINSDNYYIYDSSDNDSSNYLGFVAKSNIGGGGI